MQLSGEGLKTKMDIERLQTCSSQRTAAQPQPGLQQAQPQVLQQAAQARAQEQLESKASEKEEEGMDWLDGRECSQGGYDEDIASPQDQEEHAEESPDVLSFPLDTASPDKVDAPFPQVTTSHTVRSTLFAHT